MFTLFLFPTYGQVNKYGTPLVINYNSDDYNAAPENFTTVQSNSGVMYFGNYGYVLEYDGVNWRKIEVKRGQHILSLGIDSLGIVYVSLGNEFGYLAPDKFGLMKYFSISSLLEKEHEFVEGNGKTFVTDVGVYFQTVETIYLFSFEDLRNVIANRFQPEKIEVSPWSIDAETHFTNSYMIDDNDLFVHQEGLGLMKLKDGVFEGLQKGNRFIERKTMQILPFKKDHQIIIATEKEGLFYYTYKIGFGYFHSESNAYTDNIYSLAAITLPGAYMISTLNMGTIVIEKEPSPYKRKILMQYSRAAGLPSEQITSLYNNPLFDKDLVWLTSNFGISRTRLNTPLKRLNEASEVKDVIQDILYFNKTMYVRTLGEVYSVGKDSLDIYKFLKINNMPSNSSWLIMNVKDKEMKKVGRTMQEKLVKEDKMLIGTRSGVYQVMEENATQITMDYALNRNLEIVKRNQPNSDYYINTLYNSQSKPELLFLGLKDGLAVISNQNAMWLDEGRFDSINSNITSIAEDENGDLWLGIKNNGLLKIQFQDTTIEKEFKVSRRETLKFNVLPKNIFITAYNREDSLPVLEEKGILNFEGKLVFSTEKGLYVFNSQKNIFEPLTTFHNALGSETRILSLIADEKGNCWIKYKNDYTTAIAYFIKEQDGTYTEQKEMLRLLPEMTIQSIYPENDSIVWISGTDGLFTYNTATRRDNGLVFNTLIRKVIVDTDSVLFWGTTLNENQTINYQQNTIPILPYEHNSIKFEFASPFFDNEDKIEYSFYLEGFEFEWSKWTNDTRKEYMNLSQGTYTFHVKAKNIYGEESSVATYTFEIETPWYETWWFYIIELGSFMVLLFVSVVLNRTGRAKRLTPIITMITVVAIFKVLGALIFGPIIGMFAGTVMFFRILGDTIIGALLFPTWAVITRLISTGSFKEKKTEEKAE